MPKRSGPKIRTINLEENLPTVEEALRRLETDMVRAWQDGVRIVRVIHGYGSSGVGGKLRHAVRAWLAQAARERRVASVVHGDEYSPHHPIVRKWLDQWPELRKSLPSDTHNRGSTFVET